MMSPSFTPVPPKASEFSLAFGPSGQNSPKDLDAFDDQLNRCCEKPEPRESSEDPQRSMEKSAHPESSESSPDAKDEDAPVDAETDPDRSEEEEGGEKSSRQEFKMGITIAMQLFMSPKPQSQTTSEATMILKGTAVRAPLWENLQAGSKVRAASTGTTDQTNKSGPSAEFRGPNLRVLVNSSVDKAREAETPKGVDVSRAARAASDARATPLVTGAVKLEGAENVQRVVDGAVKNAAPRSVVAGLNPQAASKTDTAIRSDLQQVAGNRFESIPQVGPAANGDGKINNRGNGVNPNPVLDNSPASGAQAMRSIVAEAMAPSVQPNQVEARTTALISGDGEVSMAAKSSKPSQSSGREGDKQRGDSNGNSSLLSSSQAKEGPAAQKAESVRVFINRMESTVHLMKQEKSSSVQLRVSLEQGQIIKIRLNLRGTTLKTIVQSDSDGVRQVLKSTWSEVSRALADQGVDAEAPEFELGNDSSGAGTNAEGFAGEEFKVFGEPQRRGSSEETSEPLETALESNTSTRLLSRIA